MNDDWLSGLIDRLGQLRGELEALRAGRLDALEQRMTDMETEVGEYPPPVDLGPLQEEVASVGERVTTLEGAVPPPVDLSAIEARLVALEDVDTNVQKVLDALSQFVHAGHPGPAYLVDEDGNYLTDEAGNRLTI